MTKLERNEGLCTDTRLPRVQLVTSWDWAVGPIPVYTDVVIVSYRFSFVCINISLNTYPPFTSQQHLSIQGKADVALTVLTLQ